MTVGRVPDDGPNAPALGESPAPGGWSFWLGSGIGLAVIAWGVYGLLDHATVTKPLNWLLFFMGGLIVHDAIVVPCVALISVLIVRVVPTRVRPVVQATLIVGAVLALIAVPVVGGWGRLANNPSLLPLDYGRNLAIVLGVVAGVGVLLAVRAARRAPTARDRPVPPPDERPRGW